MHYIHQTLVSNLLVYTWDTDTILQQKKKKISSENVEEFWSLKFIATIFDSNLVNTNSSGI